MAARGGQKSAAPSRAVPSSARRARSRHCEADMSACRSKNVHVSCMCSAEDLCVGVCVVGVHARVLARACGCVLRRCCRMGPAPPDAAHPVLTSGTEVQRSDARIDPPAIGALFTEVNFAIYMYYRLPRLVYTLR